MSSHYHKKVIGYCSNEEGPYNREIILPHGLICLGNQGELLHSLLYIFCKFEFFVFLCKLSNRGMKNMVVCQKYFQFLSKHSSPIIIVPTSPLSNHSSFVSYSYFIK